MENLTIYDLRRAFEKAEKARQPKFGINEPVRYLGRGTEDANAFRIGRVVRHCSEDEEGIYVIGFHDGVEIRAYGYELIVPIDWEEVWVEDRGLLASGYTGGGENDELGSCIGG